MVELTVEGMTCGGCAASVTRAVQAVDPQAQVQVDLASGKVRIETGVARSALVEAIDDAGYDVSDSDRDGGRAT